MEQRGLEQRVEKRVLGFGVRVSGPIHDVSAVTRKDEEDDLRRRSIDADTLCNLSSSNFPALIPILTQR